MKLSDFHIGEDFALSGKKYRCTDIGSRVVVAVPHAITVGSSIAGAPQPARQADAIEHGWHNGPPYAAQEIVLDEYDIELCSPADMITS
jgi:hypothetical protein